MSDLNSVRAKTNEGAAWRGTIRVTIEDDEHELTVRQLTDPEFFKVMSLIDRDELQSLRDDLPDELMDEYQELQRKENLDDEESERFAELEQQLEGSSVDLFDKLSYETFEGIRKCAKLAVEPDEDDIEHAFRNRAREIEREYETAVKTPEDVKPALQDDIDKMIDQSTDFTSFAIGIQSLVETVGRGEGN
jgi:hypothetical protein